MIVDLAERLARRSTGEQVEPVRAHSFDKLRVLSACRQIAFRQRRARKVVPVGRAGVGVVVGSCKYGEACVREALAEPTGTAEKVNRRWIVVCSPHVLHDTAQAGRNHAYAGHCYSFDTRSRS